MVYYFGDEKCLCLHEAGDNHHCPVHQDRALIDLTNRLASIDDAEQRAFHAIGIITGPTPAQMARDFYNAQYRESHQ